ncbi:MAG TPA: CHAD domain-containing protein [bacterium]|nr:CHAD domain-containing protein [bacterium]HPN42177.1 CHAD domain-containing protein [bacterium]
MELNALKPPLSDIELTELIRSQLLEQVDIAHDLLLSPGMDFNLIVHDVRTSFKQIRALIRLLKYELGEEIYRIENNSFRDAGQEIADLRDSFIVVFTLNQLLITCPQLMNNFAVTAMLQTLSAWYEGKKNTAIAGQDLKNLAARLGEIKMRFANRKLLHTGDAGIFSRLLTCFAEGAGQMAAASASPTVTNLHEWRKSVKHLWYQARVFEPCRPEEILPYSERLHTLSDHLGSDHDLAVLNQVVQMQYAEEIPSELNELLACIDSERKHCQSGAFALGSQIYSEAPLDFAARFAGYWRKRAE